MKRGDSAVKRAIVGVLVTLTLAACTPPLDDGPYFVFPTARADKLTVSVGEPVEVTVMGGFGVDDWYYKDAYTTTGVNLGVCINYASDISTKGGLCPKSEQPLPDELRMVGASTIAKNFGDITVRRGELQKIEHTFSFTSDRAGVVRLVPAYLLTSEFGNLQYEPGPTDPLQITFE